MRAVFCVVDHLYRDLAVAAEVRAGRFTLSGSTVDLGTEPDWRHAALPADPEWRIDWSKFYYGLDLAHAYRLTRDAGYLGVWQRLVCSWIRQVPPDADRSDVIARRVLNWIYAWQRFGALEAPIEAALEASIGQQLRHLREHLTPERNHRTFELYALLIGSLALPSLDIPPDATTFAIEALSENLLADIRADGVHREASTHYHHVALRTYLGALENARRFDVPIPSGYRERVERACEFALHCHRPDGGIPMLSDSDSGSYLDLLALAGRALERRDFLYVASGGQVGQPPSLTNGSFPDGGYYSQRSGWGEDDRHLLFDCGPLGDGGHGHYDLLHVDVAANGAPLLVDPGRYTYAEGDPNWRRWFKGTAAHNTVSVDGLDQTPYRRGAPRGPIGCGRLLGRWSSDTIDVLWGEARSPCYEAIHRRRVSFVDGRYWLIEDVLCGERPHQYDLRWHLTSSARGATVLQPDGKVVAPGVVVAIDGSDRIELEEGWVAPSYGTKLAAPVVSAVRAAAQARFVTLIWPEGDPPAFEVRRDAQRTSVQVGRDRITWAADNIGVARVIG